MGKGKDFNILKAEILDMEKPLHRFGSDNDVMNILSASDAVFVFNISDSLDLEILSNFFRLNREDIDEIRELKPGESMLIYHRKN